MFKNFIHKKIEILKNNSKNIKLNNTKCFNFENSNFTIQNSH